MIVVVMYSYVQSDGQVRGTYGRGWVVVAGSFAVHVFVFGVSYTYGILVPSLVDHFDSGRAVVGGVSSLMIGLSWTAGTCTTYRLSLVVPRYDWRSGTVFSSVTLYVLHVGVHDVVMSVRLCVYPS